MANIEKNIKDRILSWKRSLLDMTKGNRLLWYRPYSVGSLKLENGLFDEEVQDVIAKIDELAFRDKNWHFVTELAIADTKTSTALNDNSEDDDSQLREMIKTRTNTLTTILKKVKLENEEKGLNIGYIAAGFLKWYERDDASTEVKSPLIMIPVKIEQEGRQTPFKISLNSDEQITLNPIIKKKFESDFNILLEDLPTEFDETTSIRQLISDIREKIKTQPNWSIVEDAVLDTFSFQNLAIWNDLDKNEQLILDNPFSKVLAGAELTEENFTFLEGEPELDKIKARDNLNIFEVDSSQQEAIFRAKSGESFVIQGPPGTGKSQTITNIIAEMLFLGKKILFVSEKQAALNVVYHKLEQKNLADFCLILHNSKQRKTDVREQIAKSLEISKNRASINQNALQTYENLDRQRAQLNVYSAKLHEKLSNNITPYQIIGELSRLSNTKDLIFGLPEDFNWRADYETEISDLFLKVANYGTSFIDSTSHFTDNYWQYYTGEFNNMTHREVQEKIGNITISLLNEKSNSIIINDLDATAEAEYLSILNNTPFKQTNHQEISEIIAKIKADKASIKDQHKAIGALTKENEEIKQDLSTAFTEDFLIFDRAKEFYDKLTNKYAFIFDRLFNDNYKKLANSLNDFSIKKLKYNDYVGYLKKLNRYQDNIVSMENSQHNIALAKKRIAQTYDKLAAALESKNAEIMALLENLDFSTLPEYQNHVAARDVLLNEYHLDDFISKIEDSKTGIFDAGEISEIFKKRFLTLALEKTEFDKNFSNYLEQAHNRDVDLFRQYDKAVLDISAARIRCELIARMPDILSFSNKARGGEVQLLQRELKKKSRLMSTRKLIESLPVTLPSLKPCMMMSPLTVSSYFGTNPDWQFDLVIFDEASQVKPENAITSIIRGKQVIVAGDSKQMPPTNFFAATDDDDNWTESTIDNLESILDEMSAVFPDVYLNWHYRSNDESLIAFSNNKFYNSRLATFPSPAKDHVDIGVNFVYCENGIWGNKDGNNNEAERVALLVLEHIQNHPEQSLGIVAFGHSQEDAIDRAVNKLRDMHPEYEEFFSETRSEPFFIKNLENVQGDERDRIILSCGYGKDANGTFAMRFGPLATAGGERRLNVAVSRARRSMTVVASFRASEIRGTDENPQRKLLRDFIDYAEHGIVALLGEEDEMKEEPEFDSGFEEEVYNFLNSRGYKLHTQVGSSGYKIDIVIEHPKIKGRYVLAIECDGASYHGGRTARDRDILRQEILERLGWKFYRIWSTDWFHNNLKERNRLVEAIEKAIENYDKTPIPPVDQTKPPKSTEPQTTSPSEAPADQLSHIYNSWRVKIQEYFNLRGIIGYSSGYNLWNDLYMVQQHGIIAQIIGEVLKFRNGFSPEDLFREINEQVFNKNRYTAQADDSYKDIFRRDFIDNGKVEIVNNSIRVK